MPKVASHRLSRLFPFLLLALAGCAGQLFAASCDHPLVSLQGGQLTISSDGCSLQQVLTAVSRQTGVETEIPAAAGSLPIFANLGPGDPRRVVSALLDGGPFNWTLATDTGGSGSLLRVVLSERIAFVERAAPLAGATAAQNSQKEKNGGTATAGLTPPVEPEQPRRTQIDDSTLSKMPPLPAGVPSSMWNLYPGLVNSGGAVQSGAPTLPNGQLASGFSNPLGSSDPGTPLKGCEGCPLPPGVPPGMRNLYPWNTMQLINQPLQLPNIHLPPPAQPIINH